MKRPIYDEGEEAVYEGSIPAPAIGQFFPVVVDDACVVLVMVLVCAEDAP